MLLYRVLASVLFLLVITAGCNNSNKSSDTSSQRSTVSTQDATFESAPTFVLPDLNGQNVELSQFKGKVVLLNFWATWCVPCVAEMPALERLYQKYKGLGFEIIAVNADGSKKHAEVTKFISEKDLTFTVLTDPLLKTMELYKVTGFPESFLIDREGKITPIFDLERNSPVRRVMGDRPWDKAPYTTEIERVLRSGGNQ